MVAYWIFYMVSTSVTGLVVMCLNTVFVWDPRIKSNWEQSCVFHCTTIYGLRYGLHTFTALPRSTQHSTFIEWYNEFRLWGWAVQNGNGGYRQQQYTDRLFVNFLTCSFSLHHILLNFVLPADTAYFRCGTDQFELKRVFWMSKLVEIILCQGSSPAIF